MQKIPRSCGTHSGTFHADEVTACALLNLFDLIDPDKIFRTREPSLLQQCEYVCDVGGIYNPKLKLFDHHQAEYVGPLSSAGMVLLYLKDCEIITENDFHFFKYNLILGVDAHDNGTAPQLKGTCTYSHVISNFTPIDHNSSKESQDLAFMQAFYFAKDYLSKLFRRHKYVQSCREIVAAKMETKGDYLFFEQSIPWMESFFELQGINHSAKFIIMPSGEHWKLRGIPPSQDLPMQVRVPLPEQWAGLLGDELKKLSGISGAIFCHKGRFISVWETSEDAIKALNYVLKNKESINGDSI